MFTNLIENIMPLDYFASMYGILIDQRIFANLVEFYIPDLFDKCTELNFDITLLSIKWFPCLFTTTLSQKVDFLFC